MTQDIVCMQNVLRYYKENAELLEKYRRIAEGGQCPFCDPNIENPLVCETKWWNVVLNQFPYKNSKLHLLFLPKRHILSPADMVKGEWSDLSRAFNAVMPKYPFLSNGYGFAVRAKETGGVTLYHLHYHLIAPEIGENGQISVNFGIG